MKQKKILILLPGGIGNAILFIPSLRIIHSKFPNTKVDIITNNLISGEILKYNFSWVDKIYSLKRKRYIIKIFLFLIFQDYKASIASFPTNQISFNTLPFVLRIKKRIAHKYSRKQDLRHFNFLNNVKMPVKIQHDVNKNLNLLSKLNINHKYIRSREKPNFNLKIKELKFAKDFLKNKKIKQKDFLLGVHPGSEGRYKRWPIERFVELANKLNKRFRGKTLFFIGPSEKDLIKKIPVNENIILVKNESLERVAALIKKCKIFISNDSGLMHLSASVGTKTLGIFGPTNPKHVGPYGKEHITISKYDLGEKRAYENEQAIKSLKNIKVGEVYDKILENFKSRNKNYQ